MSAKVYITIEDPASLMLVLEEGVKKGLFKSLPVETIGKLLKKTYPIKVPIELESIIDALGKPMVRKVIGSKANEAVSVCLQKVMEAG